MNNKELLPDPNGISEGSEKDEAAGLVEGVVGFDPTNVRSDKSDGLQKFLDEIIADIRKEVVNAAQAKLEEMKAAKGLSDCGLFIDDQNNKFIFVYNLGAIRCLYTETLSNA